MNTIRFEMKILALLRNGPKTVTEIQEQIDDDPDISAEAIGRLMDKDRVISLDNGSISLPTGSSRPKPAPAPAPAPAREKAPPPPVEVATPPPAVKHEGGSRPLRALAAGPLCYAYSHFLKTRRLIGEVAVMEDVNPKTFPGIAKSYHIVLISDKDAESYKPPGHQRVIAVSSPIHDTIVRREVVHACKSLAAAVPALPS